MRASGVSIGDITWSVVKAAIVMIVFVTIIGEFVAPKIEALGAQMKAVAMAQTVGFKALGGVWLRDDASFIHIGSVDSNHEISDVTRFVINRKHVLLSADYAAKGELINGHWILKNVQSSLFSPQQVTQTVTAQLPLNVVFDPTLVQTGRISIDQQSIAELYESISQYAFAFWQRVIQPFTTVVMICLGIPFIFGSLRSASMGLRLLTGVIIGFTFYMLNQFFGPFAMVYQIPPIAAAVTPTVLFAIACVILLRRSWS
jgi:lipopolysaccharide export system permease protein